MENSSNQIAVDRQGVEKKASNAQRHRNSHPEVCWSSESHKSSGFQANIFAMRTQEISKKKTFRYEVTNARNFRKRMNLKKIKTQHK